MHPNALSTGDGLTMTRASYVLVVNKKTSINYSGTPPYSHLGNMVTLLLLTLLLQKTFLTKNPLNVVTR